MRSLLVMALGLAVFCACENPAEEDAGPADVGFIDTGVDTGLPRDVGFPDSGPSDVFIADADPRLDATAGDADPTDVTPGDGGPRTGPVTIIFEQFSPFDTSGIAVFNDATGALRATRTTTVGLIVETIEEGWMVTIAREPSSAGELFTITEIAPNETYKIASTVDPPVIADMYFSFGGDPYPGATSYWGNPGCFGSFLDADPNRVIYVSITEQCASPSGTVDYVVIARDNNLDRLAFKLVEDAPIVANSTVTVTGPWRTDFTSVDLDVTNAPVGAERIYVEAAVVSNGGHYDYDGENLVLSGGVGTYTIVRPPFGEGLDTIYEMTGPGGLSWLQRNAGAPIDQTYDLGVDFLPFPGPVTVTASPIVGRPNASWAGFPGLDFVAMQVLSFTTSVRWTVFARGDATSFMFPALPPELSGAAFEDLSDILSGIRIVEAEAFAGYPDARAFIGRSVHNWDSELQVFGHAPLGQVLGAGQEIDFK